MLVVRIPSRVPRGDHDLTSIFLLFRFIFHPDRLRGCWGKRNAKLRAKVRGGGASRPHLSPLPRSTQFLYAFSLYLDPLHGLFSSEWWVLGSESKGGWGKAFIGGCSGGNLPGQNVRAVIRTDISADIRTKRGCPCHIIRTSPISERISVQMQHYFG